MQGGPSASILQRVSFSVASRFSGLPCLPGNLVLATDAVSVVGRASHRVGKVRCR